MPRANRLLLPGYAWHITHRCHRQQFLLKFARDRQRWLYWLYQSRKRYGLCVLNYIVTSNHIHLLVQDQGRGEIPRSMQLIAGRTAQEYNRRKQRRGAYWEDRYHATAIDTDGYLARCMTYIDMNMVRAGVVDHPQHWSASGYGEIQRPPKRYRIINQPALLALFGTPSLEVFQHDHRQWVEQALAEDESGRDRCWSQALAVGRRSFVRQFRHDMGISGRYKEITLHGEGYRLGESEGSYNDDFDGEMVVLRAENSMSFW